MEFVVGTYEELLLGYRVITLGEQYQLEQSFTAHTHTGCVKTVAISRKGILASGSTDETIKLFNLKKRTEMGSLMQHSGTITHVEFYRGSHMFSCAEDGTFCIWKGFTWECLKTLKEKAAIDCISVHPSGKMALSVCRDKSLHTWNLVTGKSAFITKLKQAADIVQWSTDGDYYAVVSNNKLDIYKVETAEIHCSVVAGKRINCVSFLKNTVVAYGGEGGTVHLHNIEKNEELLQFDTDTVRIRGLASTLSPDTDLPWIVVASSAGDILVYGIHLIKDEFCHGYIKLAAVNCDFRITCLAVTQPSPKNEESNKGEWMEDRQGEMTSKTKEKKTEKQKNRKRKPPPENKEESSEALDADSDSGIDDSKQTHSTTVKIRKATRTKGKSSSKQEVGADQSEVRDEECSASHMEKSISRTKGKSSDTNIGSGQKSKTKSEKMKSRQKKLKSENKRH